MRRNAVTLLVVTFLLHAAMIAASASTQNNAVITNNDVVQLKRAGLGDDVIILRIRSGPTKFAMDTDSIVALKSAQVSDAVIAEMVKVSSDTSTSSGAGQLDLSNGAVLLSFSSKISDPSAAGLPDATRTAVLNILKSSGVFTAVGTVEQAKDRKSRVEISAELVDFAGGSVTKRMMVGLGSGRAHAGFDFTVKESATGKILWKRTVKETASFWSNSASSASQRQELPEKVAKTFVEQLVKGKIIPPGK